MRLSEETWRLRIFVMFGKTLAATDNLLSIDSARNALKLVKPTALFSSLSRCVSRMSSRARHAYNISTFFFNMFELPYINQIQPVHHNINTSPTRWLKTHHITVSVITPHRSNNFKPQDFNNYPLLTCVYVIYIIWTEIIILIVVE